jgi:hypothetical protein
MTALVLARDRAQAQLVRFSPEWAPAVMGSIRTFGDGSFQYAEKGDGRDALMHPVELDNGELIDTVAWFLTNPRKWWREKLIATHLGDWSLRHAQFLQEPIRLLATPANWLTSPASAICILDWRTDLRTLLGEVPEVLCSSNEMARFLHQRLAQQVAPRFRVGVFRG